MGKTACTRDLYLSVSLRYFCRLFPSPVEPDKICDRHALFFPERAGTGRTGPEGCYTYTEATFVESLANQGYETICIGGVHFFSKRNAIGNVFPSYFKKSYWRTSFGCPEKESTRKQINFAIQKLQAYPDEQRIFMYINFSAIHYPNCHYIEGKQKDDKESHAAAFRYVDSQLLRLLEAFRKRSKPLVIAFSDHGTCYGEEGYENHCMAHEVVYTVPYKHFILDTV